MEAFVKILNDFQWSTTLTSLSEIPERQPRKLATLRKLEIVQRYSEILLQLSENIIYENMTYFKGKRLDGNK